MAQKRIGLSIDEDLNERWGKVAKKLQMTKSGMVEEFLEEVLPILEEESPNRIVQNAMKVLAKQIDNTASLFDDKR
jgi:antitoxin component of RelBE/YafQ-DinJ toxin-antitoxin module